jgi:lipoprotein-anchoring transpeptidase ErfK/SrfK
MRVSGFGLSIGDARFWRIALFTMAGAIGLDAQAEAAIYYWPDSDPGFWRPAPVAPAQRRQRARRHPDKKTVTAEKEATKPQGPLIISISISQQRMRVYDPNGLFAESPVSTGMPGHPTPMGVFSVIQKHKFHHSNIYSGAPMPFMQRITWSGVAIHAGVLPGYPASHGCIRMPMAFAVKMWNWTKMGARVIITPFDIAPAGFSHPLLASVKVPPQPTATAEPKTDIAAEAKPGADETPQTRTADAGSTSLANRPSVTMSDAAHADHGTTAEQKLSETVVDSSNSEAKPETETKVIAAKADAPKAEPAKVEANRSNEKSAASAKAAVAPSVATAEPSKDPNGPVDLMRPTAAKTDPAAASRRAGQIAAFISRKDSKLYVRQNFAPLFEVPVSISPDDRPLGTHVFTAQIDKDDANLLHWSVISLPAPSRHAERRNEDERGWRRRKVQGAAPVEVKAAPEQDSPTEALNRIKLPADAMARIAEALSSGGSIIVSDQGIAAGETGEGTDFIVRLR